MKRLKQYPNLTTLKIDNFKLNSPSDDKYPLNWLNSFSNLTKLELPNLEMKKDYIKDNTKDNLTNSVFEILKARQNQVNQLPIDIGVRDNSNNATFLLENGFKVEGGLKFSEIYQNGLHQFKLEKVAK